MQLPHARVIAVESEREFGLSVLQRLDAELRTAASCSAQVGVPGPDRLPRGPARRPPMPRILLIIDEFQEFFVEDDKIAQEVALLLDRLVRQGRAFGMHVLLGSQTLGGAYSLARSTLGQMAVRIALQCSEADAHLILSEDNTAARLLTRPGEAIYNDANGMVEGNNLFQVVWLSDERREQYLERIQELCRERHIHSRRRSSSRATCRPTSSKNPLLNRLARGAGLARAAQGRLRPGWATRSRSRTRPAAVFRPQSGSNILIVGQNDEAALAMLMMAAISIAAQHPPAARRRAASTCSTAARSIRRSHGQLGKLADDHPAPGQERHLARPGARPSPSSPPRSTAARAMPPRTRSRSSLHLRHPAVPRPPQVGRRLRLLVAATTRSKAEPAVEARSSTILRDGPPVGVHTLVWCDSVNNLNRTFDRQGLREFEIRILFQMSANDSSTLIDCPGRQQAGREPGPVLQRGREPDREVPPLRPARGGMAEPGEAAVRRPAASRGSRPGPGERGGIGRPGPAPVLVGDGAADGNGNGAADDNGDESLEAPLVESHASAMDELGDPSIEDL